LSNQNEDVKKRVALSVVRDSKTNDIILKMVNMLPAPVESVIDLSGLNLNGQEADLSVLKSTPVDDKVLPVESKIQVSKELKYTLPAYSFSVIRIKLVNQN
jgi:alpha-L-arabinofuranosidase